VDVASHFLDSGAFSLRPKAIAYHKEHGGNPWAFYNTPEFWTYMRRYVHFVKKYKIAIDLHANVDVIGNADLTWRNQQWLEKRGLTPVPVIHYGTDPNLHWLSHYVGKGYKLIGLGGLVGKMGKEPCHRWIDRCFDYICDNPKRLPCVKLHGFGVTQFRLMIRYPWWSVDSTTWLKVGGFGNILVPHKRGGKFVFDRNPYIIAVSVESSKMSSGGRHYLTLRAAEKTIVREWLDTIEVPLGDPKVEDSGILNNRYLRVKANLLFFEKLRESLPKWPWPFRPSGKHKRSLL
jgi:hypothetical protein